MRHDRPPVGTTIPRGACRWLGTPPMRREPQGRCRGTLAAPQVHSAARTEQRPLQRATGPGVPRGGTARGHSRPQNTVQSGNRGGRTAAWRAEPLPTLGPGCVPGLPVTWTAVWSGLGCLMAISLGVDSHELTMEATGKERGWGRVRRVEGPSARGQKPSADKEAVLRGGPEGQKCHTVLVLAF